MTHRGTVLPPSSSAEVAVAALHEQGRYGVVTDLANRHGISRQQVYKNRDQAHDALAEAFAPPPNPAPGGFTITVADADLERAVIAMRLEMPGSIRDIVEVLPLLYGKRWSYGKVQGVLAEAERRADERNRAVDLAAIQSVALDEMFAHQQPVFSGIDLDSGLLFSLELCPSRTGAEWFEVLDQLRLDQKLYPSTVVKDAGSALALGVSLAWTDAEQRDDLFHAVYEVGKLAYRLERAAYAAITTVEELKEKRGRVPSDRSTRSLSGQLAHARTRMHDKIDQYDRFEVLRRELHQTLRPCRRGSGRLRVAGDVQADIVRIADELAAIGGSSCSKVAGYLRNRAPGLCSYLVSLQRRLEAAEESAGGAQMVEAAVRAYLASLDVRVGGPSWDRRARARELDEAAEELVRCANGNLGLLQKSVGLVFPILVARHRASSAIENLHSVLRPYLVVQKGAHQGFLNLFRFWWNHRNRCWGRHKGTSAVEGLTGDHIADWLTQLGYPPSPGFARAA